MVEVAEDRTWRRRVKSCKAWEGRRGLEVRGFLARRFEPKRPYHRNLPRNLVFECGCPVENWTLSG